jgi:type I restriction enzyme R subunit
VCFRNLEDKVNEALGLFGDKDAGGMVLLKTYNEYLNGYEDNGKHVEGYAELIQKLENLYPIGTAIMGEDAQKGFIKLFGSILRIRNILVSFDEFKNNEMLSQRDFQDYQSVYIDLYQDYSKKNDSEKENINEDIVF